MAKAPTRATASNEARITALETGLKDVVKAVHFVIQWIECVQALPKPPCPPECLEHKPGGHPMGAPRARKGGGKKS